MPMRKKALTLELKRLTMTITPISVPVGNFKKASTHNTSAPNQAHRFPSRNPTLRAMLATPRMRNLVTVSQKVKRACGFLVLGI